MARTKTTTIHEQTIVDVDTKAAAAGANALTVLGTRSAEVAAAFDNDLPYERNRVVSEARFYAATSGEAMFELGKRLILIRENEGRAEYLDIVQVRLGIEPRLAQRLIQGAVKFQHALTKASAPTLLALGRTKMMELLPLDDDEIDVLTDGGTVAGLVLDDMQAMSARELRAALVEARKASAAKDRIISKKDELINKQAEKLERRMHGRDEQAAQKLEELRGDTIAAENANARLVATAAEIFDIGLEDSLSLAARQAIDWVQMRFVEDAAIRAIAIEPFDGQGMPAFLDDVAAVVNRKTKA